MKKNNIFKKIFSISPWFIESLAALGILIILNSVFLPKDPGYLSLPLHPYWIVVLLIAARYGFGGGLFVGLITAGTYFFYLFHKLPSRVELEKAAEAGDLWVPIAFLVVGLALGEVRQIFILRERAADEKLDGNEREIKRLGDAYQGSEKARHVLEGRIVGQAATIKTLYDSARKLESLESHQVYEGCLDILQTRLQVEKSSLYLFDGHHYVLKASRGWEEGSAAEGKIPGGSSMMDLVLRENRVLTVREILSDRKAADYADQYGQTLAMLPLRDEHGRPIGCINIEKIDFLALNQANLELMQLVVDWTGQTLETISRFKSLEEHVIYDAEEKVYTYVYFKECLEREFARAKKFNLGLSVVLIKLEGFGFLQPEAQQVAKTTAITMLRRYLAETDLLFQYRFGGTFAVLAPVRDVESVSVSLSQVAKEMSAIQVKISSSIVAQRGEMENPEELLQGSYQKIT